MSWFGLGIGIYLGYLVYKVWQDPKFKEKLKKIEE
jgi:hypothetical protein